MVIVHIGPVRSIDGGVLGELYRIPHGRAAILFVLVAGIGVSLLARGRASAGHGEATAVRGRTRWRDAVARLGWRALILLPLGLALQSLGTGVAVILQYYALWFVIAIVAVRLPGRVLLGLAALFSIGGPVAVLVARRTRPEWFGPIPEWSEFERVARDLVISGTYPTAVWLVPLLIGIWIGRQDLRTALVPARLLVAGAALAGTAYGCRYLLEGVAGAAGSRTDWLQLAAIQPHNEMPLWVLSSSGIAMAIVGAATLLAQAAPRGVWSAMAMGQLALTIYVGHLLVLWQRPDWLRRGQFPEAWEVVGLFLLVTLVVATLWRLLVPRGPVEALFHLPWWWLRRRRRPASPPAAPASAPLVVASAATELPEVASSP